MPGEAHAGTEPHVTIEVTAAEVKGPTRPAEDEPPPLPRQKLPQMPTGGGDPATKVKVPMAQAEVTVHRHNEGPAGAPPGEAPVAHAEIKTPATVSAEAKQRSSRLQPGPPAESSSVPASVPASAPAESKQCAQHK